MAKALSFTMSIPGVEVSINYLPSNKRITTVEWAIPVPGVVARCRIYNNGNLVIDRSAVGVSSGVESIPGNFQVVEKTDYSGTYYDLPPEITYTINIETIGQ